MGLGSGIRDPGSGKKPIPDPGSRGQKAPDPGFGLLESEHLFVLIRIPVQQDPDPLHGSAFITTRPAAQSAFI